tara:strand:- start:13422 stop:13901 length:480 start_codon:yes stop_codon:yes gene_type:complete
MGKHKKIIKIIIRIIVIILLFSIFSCSPIKRHARLVKKYPFVHQTDTVILRDTINLIVPRVQTDTIIQLDSFLISLKDTIVLTKENLIVKITQLHDSIYIDAKCDTVFVDKIIVQKIPIKYYETKKNLNLKQNGIYLLYLLIILLILIIVFKFIQLLKK